MGSYDLLKRSNQILLQDMEMISEDRQHELQYMADCAESIDSYFPGSLRNSDVGVQRFQEVCEEVCYYLLKRRCFWPYTAESVERYKATCLQQHTPLCPWWVGELAHASVILGGLGGFLINFLVMGCFAFGYSIPWEIEVRGFFYLFIVLIVVGGLICWKYPAGLYPTWSRMPLQEWNHSGRTKSGSVDELRKHLCHISTWVGCRLSVLYMSIPAKDLALYPMLEVVLPDGRPSYIVFTWDCDSA